MILTFGRYKGQRIENVPTDYLRWLCRWNHSYDKTRTPRLREHDAVEAWTLFCGDIRSTRYLWERQPEAISAARQYVRQARLCHRCFQKLVPIGNHRNNGAWHEDWEGRYLHKICWKEIVVQSELFGNDYDNKNEDDSDDE